MPNGFTKSVQVQPQPMMLRGVGGAQVRRCTQTVPCFTPVQRHRVDNDADARVPCFDREFKRSRPRGVPVTVPYCQDRFFPYSTEWPCQG